MNRYEEDRDPRPRYERSNRNPYRDEPNDDWAHEAHAQPERAQGPRERGDNYRGPSDTSDERGHQDFGRYRGSYGPQSQGHRPDDRYEGSESSRRGSTQSWEQNSPSSYGPARHGYGYQGSYPQVDDRASESRGSRGQYSGQGQYGGEGRHGTGSGAQGGQRSSEAWRGSDGFSPQSGQHFGKGPKGYRRSDERIKEDVSERLQGDGDIDASEIEIQVKDGEVVLTGTVSDRQQKRAAEECAERISGVKDVDNRLKVKSGKDQAHASESSTTGQQSTSQSGKPQQQTQRTSSGSHAS